MGYFITRQTRIIVMYFLILCFLIAAPLVILYTAGYRYNLSDGGVKHTGVLNIDARPVDAGVFLNNVKQKKRLPIYLPNRAPGTYKIKLEKAGYKTWEKDIIIESNKTAYIKNVVLFKESLPVQVLENFKNQLINVSFAPSGRYAALVSREKNSENIFEVDLYNTAEKSLNPVLRARLDSKPVISWSPFADFASIKTKIEDEEHLQIFDAENPEVAPSYQFKAAIENQRWIKDAMGPAAYIWSDNEVFLINTASKQNVTEKKPEIIDSTPEYSVTRSNTGILVTQMENGEPKEDRLLSMREIVFNQQTGEWLAWSPWELWTIYKNGTVSLLNRTSDRIISVVPLDVHGLLLLSSENKMVGFNPGYYTTHELFSGGKIDSVGVDIKMRKIYFWGELGQRKGIFELEY